MNQKKLKWLVHSYFMILIIFLYLWVCRGFDDEMRAVVARNLEGRGIHVHPRATLTEVAITILYNNFVIFSLIVNFRYLVLPYKVFT